MKVLLVEDDKRTAEFVCRGLKQEGFSVDHATNGLDGLLMASSATFDIAVVDIMLPKLDGLSLVQEIRDRKITLPIIILSAKGSVDDRIKGLETGSDDYMAKPFSFSELLARMHALIRRTNATVEGTTITLADLTVDLTSRRVHRGGERIDIQPLEYALLVYLLRNKGRVVSKTAIMENVWEYNFDPGTNVVESRVCRLRDKIDRPFASPLIHTVRGFGYVIEART